MAFEMTRRASGIAGVLVIAVWSGSAPQSPTAPDVCTGFSQERRDGRLPIEWSYRLCSTDVGVAGVEMRFRNTSDEAIRFTYRVWLGRPRSCSANDAPAAHGTVALAPQSTSSWPYTRVPIHARDPPRLVSLCLHSTHN